MTLRIFDFELTAGDMARIDAFPETRLSGHPDEVEF